MEWHAAIEVCLASKVATCALLTLPGRRRYESSDSDSSSDTDSSSPRPIRSRKHYMRDLPVARVEPNHNHRPNRSRSVGATRSRSQGPPSHPRRYDSENDSSSSDNTRGKKVHPKPPPKQILYTGLACVATIAAANNIYQSTKAHYTRQKELEEGEISREEAEKMKARARKMDLISLGVAAVGAYNVRNGWKRAEGHVSILPERLLHTSNPISSLRTCVRSKTRISAPQSKFRLRNTA